jgi:hypothetical protein
MLIFFNCTVERSFCTKAKAGNRSKRMTMNLREGVIVGVEYGIGITYLFSKAGFEFRTGSKSNTIQPKIHPGSDDAWRSAHATLPG